MKLNRKLILILALLASVAMATTSTLAFLTDRDTVSNTFTMGNVDITVEEIFEQGSKLAPGAAVEKQAGVKNTHLSADAWVWMAVSVPVELDPYIQLGWLEGTQVEKIVTVIHEGYVSYVVKHPEVLAAGQSTPKYLQSVTLSTAVSYQDGQFVAIENGMVVAYLGDMADVVIHVDGFAMQIEGFNTVEEAYNAYFEQWGGMNGGNATGNSISNVEELKAALKAGGSYKLGADIAITEVLTVEGNVIIDLNGFGINATGIAGNPFVVAQDGSLEITAPVVDVPGT